MFGSQRKELSENGVKSLMEELTLDVVEKDKEMVVMTIEGGWGARHRLNRLGIHPGDTIVVKRSGMMRGPIHIRVHGMEVALGRGMASKVVVRGKDEKTTPKK